MAQKTNKWTPEKLQQAFNEALVDLFYRQPGYGVEVVAFDDHWEVKGLEDTPVKGIAAAWKQIQGEHGADLPDVVVPCEETRWQRIHRQREEQAEYERTGLLKGERATPDDKE